MRSLFVAAFVALFIGAAQAEVIKGEFSGTVTRVSNGDPFFGPGSSNLVGQPVTGTVIYDTASFVGEQCENFSGPNLFCVNQTLIVASVSVTIAGQTFTVTQSSDAVLPYVGNFALGDNVLGVIPGIPSASSDYFALSTFDTSASGFVRVGSIVYVPGPGVDFIHGIDPTQTFQSVMPLVAQPTFGADGFANSILHLGTGIVDFTVTALETSVCLPTALRKGGAVFVCSKRKVK